ncbi:hypothetical protein BpHYR1_028663 [Brachionus plicatilis]|uniref:Uncharacterized protein n=1 Tax=Brachionus plicatilis TaxID=10195 RepID=A0A3M7P9Y8_BRAPC|nr:hypothetical protein BpHYR1_028663 [Brachionus plicatilis]
MNKKTNQLTLRTKPLNKARKPRNKYGGGVAILIKQRIEFIQDFSYEEFNSELLCIKINLGKNNELFIFNLYDPPNVLLNFEFLKTLIRISLMVVVDQGLSDANKQISLFCSIQSVVILTRTKQLNCVGENENGIILERIINDKLSPSLIDKIIDFCVLNSQDMTIDYFAIEASISMGYQLENKSAAKKINYKKANWQLFSEIFNSKIKNYFCFTLKHSISFSENLQNESSTEHYNLMKR